MARYYEDELTHYGVIGMRWGIRRYQPYSYTGGSGKEVGLAKKLSKADGSSERRAQRKARKKANKAIIKQRKEDVKNRRTMTDEELNERINRIRKENELAALTNKNIETPISKEAKRLKDKYLDRIENNIVDTTYKGAKLAAKVALKKKLPFSGSHVDVARASKDGELVPKKRKPHRPNTEFNPNTSESAKSNRDKILERSRVDGISDRLASNKTSSKSPKLEKFYKTKTHRGQEYTSLNKKGLKYNQKQLQKVKKIANSALYNINKSKDKNISKALDNYNKTYDALQKKGGGENSIEFINYSIARNNLYNTINKVVTQHPGSKETYTRLNDSKGSQSLNVGEQATRMIYEDLIKKNQKANSKKK